MITVIYTNGLRDDLMIVIYQHSIVKTALHRV